MDISKSSEYKQHEKSEKAWCKETDLCMTNHSCLKEFKKGLSPSLYMKKMQGTTCQWLECQRQKKMKHCPLAQEKLIFQPFPRKLVFKNFTPNSLLFLPLCFKNVNELSRSLKVEMEESPHFKLVSPVESEKIGPGLTALYKVLFMPDENKDYQHYVTYWCEGRESRISIRALGPRPILDFADRIDFPMCPVKYLSSKTIFVKNIGTCAACFDLRTNMPFSVSPRTGILNINENMQVTLNFYPLSNGNHCGHLIINYGMGEEVHVELFGMSDDVSVRLEKNVLKMDSTYVNMPTTKNALLLNRSDIVASFKWSPFATLQEEEMHRNMLANHSELSRLMDNSNFEAVEPSKFPEPNHSNKSKVTPDFCQEILHIDPMEGHVWPKSSMTIKITFQPNEPGEWNKTIYCDVEGRESRLPLTLKGYAVGPTLEFSCKFLEIGNVFISSINIYEVVLHNKGPISASFCLQEDDSELGSCFEVNPVEGTVEQESCQLLQIFFSRKILGPFEHTLFLNVGSLVEPLQLSIRGSIEAPSVSFDVDQIDFETISLGFEKLVQFRLSNTSPMPIEFQIRIINDFHSALPSKSNNDDDDDTFQVEPSFGALAPQSNVEVSVTFRPKQPQSYQCHLTLDIIDVKDSAFSLPIRARSILPLIKILTPTLAYDSIPKNFPVTKNIKLQNDSDLPGKYIISKLETNILSCFSVIPEGIIEPLSHSIVPLTVVARHTEEIQDIVNIYLPGSNQPLEVRVRCKGEGPVVTLSHEYLDWGIVPVLTLVSKSIVLYNHSPIPAQFKAQLFKSTGICFVNPTEGVIPSEGRLFLDVMVNLNDSISFSDDLQIMIEDSSNLNCQVRAQGRGSTIVLDPKLLDCTELGPQLCRTTVTKSFEVVNHGCRIQSVTFKIMQLPLQKKMNRQKKMGKSIQLDPVLQIVPSRLELLPGMKSEITVSCSSNVPCYLEKTVSCQAIVGLGGSKEDVGEFKFLCHFVDPIVKLSPASIKFQICKHGEEELTIQHEAFSITNTSSITVGVSLEVEQPFFLSFPSSGEICGHLVLNISAKQCQDLMIWFNPTFEQDRHTRCLTKKVKISFHNHPHREYLIVQGNVYYPNLKMDRSSMNFGCILSDTISTSCLIISNHGPLPVSYFWSFSRETTLFFDVPEVIANAEECMQVDAFHPFEGYTRFLSPVEVLIIENKPVKQKELPSKMSTTHKKEDACIESRISDHKSFAMKERSKIKLAQRSYKKLLASYFKNNTSCPIEDCYLQEISSELIGVLPDLVHCSPSVEEVFHIEPMFGSLQAGESEIVTFVFHGYPYINCSAKAICNVLHGPSYEVSVLGESSFISYEFDSNDIDYGSVHYNKMSRGVLKLKNTGKVDVTFKVLIDELKQRSLNISPLKGTIKIDCMQIFSVGFCPGRPLEFHYDFEIQVAHFQPEIFHLKGCAFFPRVLLDLPLNTNGSPIHDKYCSWINQATENLKCKDISQTSYCEELQLETEQLVFVDHLQAFPSLDEERDFFLQDYLVDFGALTLTTIASKIIQVTNPGTLDVSFYVSDKTRRNLEVLGLTLNILRVCNLPPKCSTNFEVTFDPRISNLEFGSIVAELPIHITEGPSVNISICCQVLLPNLSLSETHLNFSEVLCQECKIITIQLFNEQEIECCWSLESRNRPGEKKEKHGHLKRSISNDNSCPVFDLIPSHGVVQPNCRSNVQVKFTPRTEKEYQTQLQLLFKGSSITQSLVCIGKGLEKRIEIIGESLEFGPVLPNSEDDIKNLIIRNPTCHPIELFCLEMDEIYLQEEKVMRLLNCYDDFNNVLLPPRLPGEGLHQVILKYYIELVQAYQESNEGISTEKKVYEITTEPEDTSNEFLSQDISEAELKQFQQECFKERCEWLVKGSNLIKTLTKDIKTDTGINDDHFKKGIVIFVHGSPKSGKSLLSQALALDFGATVLTLDGVIKDALETRSSPAGIHAYDLCQQKVQGEVELTYESGTRLSSNGMKSIANEKGLLKKEREEGKCITLTNGTKLWATILPEDVIIALLSERLMFADCLTGVIFDGLDSLFTESCQDTVLCFLKAVGKRQFIYAISLKLPYESFKKKQEETSAYRLNQLKAQEMMTLKHLNDISEDEFDTFNDEDKKEFNRRSRDFKKALLERKKTEELERSKHEKDEKEDKQGKGKKKKVDTNEKLVRNKDHRDAGPRTDASDLQDHEPRISSRHSISESCCSMLHEDDSVLEQRFISFENEFVNISNIFEFWDQKDGSLKALPSSLPVDADQIKKTKKQNATGNNKKDKVNEMFETLKADDHDETPATDLVVKEGSGITHFIVNVSCQHLYTPYFIIAKSNVLPNPNQVLEALGLNKTDLDIPPPVTFSVVPYPSERSSIITNGLEYFQFVDSSTFDGISQAEIKENVNGLDTSSPSASKHIKQIDVTNEESSFQNLENQGKLSFGNEEDFEKLQKLFYFHLKKSRWIVPAMSEIILNVKFRSDKVVNVCKSLNFELVGCRKKYQITLSGLCCFPTISDQPKVIFPSCIRTHGSNEIVIKKFIHSKNIFDFGPLLVGKSREKYKDCVYPENGERLNIVNISPFEVAVNFAFLDDKDEETFLLHPAFMILYPGETKFLHVWAYPKAPGVFQDSLVCCIKSNPEPVVFKLTCQGSIPELEFDTQLDFEGVLLHRQQSKAVILKNKTSLPITWKLMGLDGLGKEFSVCTEEGLIPPLCSYEAWFHFKADKPVTILNKSVRLEVYDATKIIGLTQSENIFISAEAYDVALDISFAKGSSGGIDFGLSKVGEEVQQICTLRNKGKYNTSFRFELSNDKKNMDINKHICIDPLTGLLLPNEKPTSVLIKFFPKHEINVKDLPLLKCLVIDSRSFHDSKESIANIPIKVSARSTWTKFKIVPSECINFGPLALGERKTMQIVIENTGEKFDLKFSISQEGQPVPIPVINESSEDMMSKKKQSGNMKLKKKEESKKKEELKSQEKVTVGIFLVYPSSGIIEAGSQAIINIECSPDIIGKHKEVLLIDIPGIKTKTGEANKGMYYNLMAEFCLPRIEIHNESLIFEEHYIERNLEENSKFSKHLKGVGFYNKKEKRFVFNNLFVGSIASARFKIINVEKIPCSVTFDVNTFNGFASDGQDESAFVVSPPSYQIPPLECIYVNVSFSPTAMKTYSAIFEASVDGTKDSNLTFEIFGEGVLPYLRVLKPVQRSESNNLILNFRKIQVHHKETLPIQVLNEGVLPCNVYVQLIDLDDVFSICLKDVERCSTKDYQYLSIVPGETFSILVSYMSQVSRKSKGQLKLKISENDYDETVIELLAESFKEDVYLHVPSWDYHFQNKVAESKGLDALHFGNCGVEESRTMAFQMINTLSPDLDIHYKFEWLHDHELLTFLPKVGHLKAGSCKDIYVTFKSTSPIEICEEVTCELVSIVYNNKSEPKDWDDRLKVVKWINMPNDLSNNEVEACHQNSKRKFKTIDSEPEPSYVEIGNRRKLTLLITASSQYCQYSMPIRTVIFKDTPLYESRTYGLKVTNSGKGHLKFKWDFALTENILGSSLLPAIKNFTSHALGEGCKEEKPCKDSFNASRRLKNCPFSIYPASGTIPPGEFLEFSVKFFPLAVSEYTSKFVCNIQHLEPGSNIPKLEMRGRCVLPHYHFELETSDYLSKRNKKWLSSKLSLNHLDLLEGFICDPIINVIEFHAVGICKAVVKRFCVINPTTFNYSFNWLCLDPEYELNVPPFVCHTPSGCLPCAKRQEMTFVFTPTCPDVIESMWKFYIPELNVTSKFILVGKTREPNVLLEECHHNFGPALVGNKCIATVALLNHEDVRYSYSVDPQSCLNVERNEVICIRPAKGVLAPRSNIQITLEYSANSEGEANFNIRFNVECMLAPLNLNIKAHGYLTKASVTYLKQCGSVKKLRNGCFEEIDFGKVRLYDSSVVSITIENLGSLGIDFVWQGKKNKLMLDLGDDVSPISIKPILGFINQGEKTDCNLVFQPTKEMTLKNVELILTINQSETYHLILKGSTDTITLRFSALCFDFGKRFVYEAGHEVPCAELTITNQADKPTSLNCLQQPDLWLSFSFEPKMINPQKSITLKFKFYAREAIAYHRVIPFIIDEVVIQNVQFYGEGICVKLEIENPIDKVVHLGALHIGQCIRKIVSVCNNSLAPVQFSLNIHPVEKDLLMPGTLVVQPSGSIFIPELSCFKIEITFDPKKRIAQFMESVIAESEYFKKTLFVITGAAQGFELSLNTENINFGICVPGGTSSQNLIMSNIGDIGSRFSWDAQMLLPDFEINPLEGYSPPGTDVHFKVTFNPKEVNEELNCKVKCLTDYQYAPVLTLSGACVSYPPPIETIAMQTTVRKKDQKTIEVFNPKEQSWIVKPVINGDFFSGADLITLPPKSTKSYDIIYHPLVMTDKMKHSGTLFIPMSDGLGIMYNLLGTSDPPEAEEQLNRNIPSRVHYTESLRVKNWLNKMQRFKVTFHNVVANKDLKENVSSKGDGSLVMSGVDYIEVPAQSTKEYQLSLFSYREGSFHYKVIFKNTKTKEYIFYELQLNFARPDVIGCICLQSMVRQKMQHNFVFQNPLMVPATFIPSCTIDEIEFPQKLVIPGLMERTFTIEYFPLKPGKMFGKLELSSDEIGSHIYELEVNAVQGVPEKTLRFQTFIGSKQSFTAKFINFAKSNTDYICQIEEEDFICEESVAAPSTGCEVSVNITYQPSKIGTINSSMIAFSPHGGSYIFPLVAECFPPKPQGPYTVKSGSTMEIPFKNVFKNAEVFEFQVDNLLFKLNSYNETILPQKEHIISVSYSDGNSNFGLAETGKLTISHTQSNDMQGIQWVYYLKGVSPEV